MNLTSKLRRFLPQQKSSPERIGKPKADLDPFLHGQEVTTPFGPCYAAEKVFPSEHIHGFWTLQDTRQVTAETLRRLGQDISSTFDLNNTLFLDTETTGLAGGTGTYAFLVGTGRFSDAHFVVKQFLMRDYNEELALLYLLDQELQDIDTIITFNGKTFDLPLLQTRFTISRLDFNGTKNKEHLDLLHMSRKLWRHKLESCSLNSLEENLLGVTRTGDIPGYEIPQRYFQFLQTGQGLLLQDIVEHNVIDVVSMAALLYRIYITTELKPNECDCPWEAEALAQICIGEENQKQALRYLHTALQLCENTEHQVQLLRTTALLYRRMKDYETACKLWRRLLELSNDDIMAYEELAKHYEHRLNDLKAASHATRRALAIAWQTKSPKVPDLEHRLRRIEDKSRRQIAAQ
ncbi:MAG: hypothetical protein GX331_10260 [Firmicutes bacterium]|nr:hypothetical protein [Bacillota bacterium]